MMHICTSANAYLLPANVYSLLLVHIQNEFFKTLKSESHYRTLTLRTLSEHNCALLGCEQILHLLLVGTILVMNSLINNQFLYRKLVGRILSVNERTEYSAFEKCKQMQQVTKVKFFSFCNSLKLSNQRNYMFLPF